MKPVELLDARMPRDQNLFCLLVKIDFIYHTTKKDPPYTMWADYRKVGEAYLLDADSPHSQLPRWIPEELHRLTPETHEIKIVTNNDKRQIRPLRIKNVRSGSWYDGFMPDNREVIY